MANNSVMIPVVAGLIVGIALIVILSITFQKTETNDKENLWLAINPMQCLSNPWEQEWLQAHDNQYGEYPRANNTAIARIIDSYYERQGITIIDVRITEFQQIPNGNNNPYCEACSCAAGYTVFVLVSELDKDKMLNIGFGVPDRTL